MSLERDESNFVNKPVEFKMSDEWQRQWEVFTHLIDYLSNNGRQSDTILYCLGYDEAKEYMKEDEAAFFLNNKDEIDCVVMNDLVAWTTGKLEENCRVLTRVETVRKQFLIFNRKCNYQWHYNRAKVNVEKYEEARERLSEFKEHIELPDVVLPKLNQSLVMPFVEETAKLIQTWIDCRYDFNKQDYRMNPAQVVRFRRTNRPRMVLRPKEEGEEPSGWEPKLEYNLAAAFDIQDLLKRMNEVKDKYDIESIFNRAYASIRGIEHTFESE
ncbi:MAG: hypothetical protein CMA57_05045 [Euryarchaeota archaeon]|nr:hypothetical protein [Euryarchaeota archaeon]|tara:strand:+ start:5888 stop:6697 length:810 start_codon:yes stop_codon:yes gene_type:complete